MLVVVVILAFTFLPQAILVSAQKRHCSESKFHLETLKANPSQLLYDQPELKGTQFSGQSFLDLKRNETGGLKGEKKRARKTSGKMVSQSSGNFSTPSFGERPLSSLFLLAPTTTITKISTRNKQKMDLK